MRENNPLLEPFDPETLETIRSAFQAGWHELCNMALSTDPQALRNQLAGTIAHLAKSGVSDPLELKVQALRNVTANACLN